MASEFEKDPGDVLDYQWDWAGKTNGTGNKDWLASGETISSATVTVPTGITLDLTAPHVLGYTTTTTTVTAWITGGTDGTDYKVDCAIVTSAGRTVERSIWIRVRE